MNTVKKGNQLERQVFELLKRIIDGGDFWAKKENCKLRRKARYFSRDREKEIEFDLAIEIRFQHAIHPSLIVPIECKNYAHPVPVNDVEEFISKYQQVGAHKGIIVSCAPFQKSAQTYAKNKGVGLIRYLAEGEHKWILHRSTAANCGFAQAGDQALLSHMMTSESCGLSIVDMVCETSHSLTTSLREFFDGLLDYPRSSEWSAIQSPVRRLGSIVPYVRVDEIERLADEVSTRYATQPAPIDFEPLCTDEHERSGLTVIKHQSAPPAGVPSFVLGRFRLQEKTIELFQTHAKSLEQMNFTLAHELGHHFLEHSRYLALDTCDQSDLGEREPSLIDLTDIARLEWQANRFASCLLMPSRFFIYRFKCLLEMMDIKDKGHGLLYVDDRPWNVTSFNAVCSDLSRTFNVSFGVVAIRLQALGLLNDQRASSKNIRSTIQRRNV